MGRNLWGGGTEGRECRLLKTRSMKRRVKGAVFMDDHLRVFGISGELNWSNIGQGRSGISNGWPVGRLRVGG